MDGVTDEPYRLVQAQIAKPDIIFTEFVSAEGLAHNAVKLFQPLLYSAIERPIIGQLFGKDPDSFYQAAVIFSALGFDGIDINMGCPAHTVTQHGSGAALIKNPDLASKIIEAVRHGINDYFAAPAILTQIGLKEKTLQAIAANNRYSGFQKATIKPTLSVKTRLGYDTSVVSTWIPFLLEHQLDFLTLHGRTLKQMYAPSADWQQIALAQSLTVGTETRFFGNGDIKDYTDAQEKIAKYHLDGALIGRSTMGNPWVFCHHPIVASPRQRFDAMLLHAQIATSLFPDRRFEILRRHFLSYAAGLPTAKHLRSQIVAINSLDDLLQLEPSFVSC